jgi:hypothetical protein
MARSLIAEFGIVQKTLAGASVAVYEADSNGESTGTLATIYQASTGGAERGNPITLSEDGKLPYDCYVEVSVVAAISNISEAVDRSLRKIRVNPLMYPLPVTSSGVNAANVAADAATASTAATTATTQAGIATTAATTATTQAGIATTQASNAASSASAAQTAETNAETAETNAEAAQAAAEAAAASVGFTLSTNNTFTGINTYTKQVRWAKGADVASANALTLGTDGNYFDITGTTAITSIGTLGVGTIIKLHFDAALTLTHNATDLILPAGVNITTAAGDEAEFIEYASGDWRCTQYTRANGQPVAFMGIPISRSPSAAITFAATDNGRCVRHPASDTTARTWTIDSNANLPLEVGTCITISNEHGAGALTIAITTDTLRLAGPGTTGSRTVAANGIATIFKSDTTLWYISGPGVS